MAKLAADGEATVDSPIMISFKQFVDYAFNLWLDALKNKKKLKTLCLLGSPGIGKSSTAEAIVQKMADYVRANPALIYGPDASKHPAKDEINAIERVLDFSSMLPEDLNGLPFRNGNMTEYCPQRWVHQLVGDHAFGVVVQDDLPAAAPSMHTAGRQMALERRIHDHRFGPGVLIVVTGNRREDKAGAHTLPSHFRNSVTLLQIQPDLDEWKRWYGRQEGHDVIVQAFLTWKPELFSMTPQAEDKMGAFPTPRQWASLGSQFEVADASGKDVLFAVAAGCVGKGHATTFAGFVEIYSKLPDPDEVLDNPKGVMPNPSKTLDEPSKQIAMTCALGDAAARRFKAAKGNDKTEIPLKLFKAIAHVCDGVGEYSATGVQTFLDSGGNLTAIAKIASTHRTDPVIGPLLDIIKESLLGVPAAR